MVEEYKHVGYNNDEDSNEGKFIDWDKCGEKENLAVGKTLPSPVMTPHLTHTNININKPIINSYDSDTTSNDDTIDDSKHHLTYSSHTKNAHPSFMKNIVVNNQISTKTIMSTIRLHHHHNFSHIHNQRSHSFQFHLHQMHNLLFKQPQPML